MWHDTLSHLSESRHNPLVAGSILAEPTIERPSGIRESGREEPVHPETESEPARPGTRERQECLAGTRPAQHGSRGAIASGSDGFRAATRCPRHPSWLRLQLLGAQGRGTLKRQRWLRR